MCVMGMTFVIAVLTATEPANVRGIFIMVQLPLQLRFLLFVKMGLRKGIKTHYLHASARVAPQGPVRNPVI